MDRRKLLIALAALLVVVAAAFGFSLTQTPDAPASKVEVAAKEEKLQDVCASSATYARLKEVAFEEAVRIRNADPANLDTLAATSVVRMEEPVVKSRDDALNVTVCTGRFVLELPPGAERAFAGERRLAAQVEYAAQSAADGSGLVFQMSGAEPIIYRLAAFDLQGGRLPPAPVAEPTVAFAEAETNLPREASPPAEQPASAPVDPRLPPPPRPLPRVEPREPTRTAAANPSFNCRYARSRSERMVCSSDRLAARDRAMASQFYSALSDADPRTRRELRRTRDAFLAYRERCADEDCVAQAYEGRMAEISDITGADE